MNKIGFVVLILFFPSKCTFPRVLQKQAWLCEWRYRWLNVTSKCQSPLPAFHVAVNNASTCPWFWWVRWCGIFFLGYVSTDVHTRLWEAWELHAVICDREDWVIMAQNALVVPLRLNSVFMLGYPGSHALGPSSWWPDLGTWAAAPQSGVSCSRLLSWHRGKRSLPTKGEGREIKCLCLDPSSLKH